MGRPKTISIPIERPHICAECPLLVRRPSDDVGYGSKYTLRCLLPMHQHNVSGRGSKTPTARHRCKEKEWKKVFMTYSGDVQVGEREYKMYEQDPQGWLFQRDARLTK